LAFLLAAGRKTPCELGKQRDIPILLKDAPRHDLIAAVKNAAAGNALLAPSVTILDRPGNLGGCKIHCGMAVRRHDSLQTCRGESLSAWAAS
jgi:hypothetical protein